MSEEPIARYSFLPWLRQGVTNSITLTDNLGTGPSGQGERAHVDIHLEVNNDAGNPIDQPVAIFGPGDITSLDPRAVVRTEPRNGITDFEDNYLALIEFYDEDFPWRYTPAKAVGDRLRPWICLWVLEEGEYEDVRMPGKPVAAIRVLDPATVLPKPSETWAWAHVHANRDLTPNKSDGITQALANLESYLSQDADLAYSRLICPRRLKANSRYSAFVVPAFETGRLAGLGQSIPNAADGLAPAWGNGQNEFPVYYRWFFRTGNTGDFEYLVRLLEPRVMGPEVGIRPMDVQNPAPEYSIPGISDPPELGLEGALRSPQTVSTPWPPVEPPPVPFRQAVATLLNLPEDLKDANNSADPLVAPPIYGRWHAKALRVQAANNPPWLDELNLDPRHRTESGFGTQVVQKNQEDYMNAAWQQVDQINEANRRMRFAQLAREVSLAFYRKHFTTLEAGQLLSLSAPVLGKVLASPITIREKLRGSTLPTSAVDPAFRRALRLRGPLARRNPAGGGVRMGRVLDRLSRGEITAAAPKQAPEKQIEPGDLADKLYPAWVPAWLRPYLRWLRRIALALAILLLVFAILAGVAGSGWLAALLGAAALGFAAAAAYLQRQDVQWRAAESLRESGLTTKAVQSVPARPNFQITQAGQPIPDPGRGGQDSPQAANFRQALMDLHGRFEVKLPAEPARVKLELQPLQASLVRSLDPRQTVTMRLLSQINISAFLAERPDPIEPVMATPDLPFPMYIPLKQISPELLIPNLNLIPQNTITLLETNEPFIEAYMVGVNHEMMREFKWREFETDNRGTPMRQFWDVSGVVNTEPNLSPKDLAEKLKDIKPIHAWKRTGKLGVNGRFGTSGERLVLVIRGDLLKKYPNAVIYAAEAKWSENILKGRELTENEKYPLFHAEVEPDLTMLGFDLTEAVAKGSPRREDKKPGWFFVIKERPGEPRFGLDIADQPATSVAHKWDDLSWGHLTANAPEFQTMQYIELTQGANPNQTKALNKVAINQNPDSVFWGTNSADMAHILYQVPVLVAVHGDEMLE